MSLECAGSNAELKNLPEARLRCEEVADRRPDRDIARSCFAVAKPQSILVNIPPFKTRRFASTAAGKRQKPQGGGRDAAIPGAIGEDCAQPRQLRC